MSEKHICHVCKSEFEAWDAEFECNNCDEYGQEERWYDWSFGEPDLINCTTCKGEKYYTTKETGFCSDDCREQYFYPSHI